MQDETQKNKSLSKLLRSTKQTASVPPRFQEAVWNRIECGQTQRRQTVWQSIAVWIESSFRQPALAVAYVAVLLFAGIGAGYWHAEDRQAQTQSEMRTRYVQAVDPYQMPRN
jgi:hypothetical protein